MTEGPVHIRLLLVDDEIDFLEAMCPGLVRRGFLVTTAESGHRALALLSSQTFDVVVLDVKMPEIDGIDTFVEIKRLAPQLPVIMLTGHGNVQQAFETSRKGVYDYLTKPCDVSKLADIARRAVQRNASAASSRPERHTEIRILLVDDDRDFLDAITAPLQRRGALVWVAHSGREALEITGEQELHVAVVDMVMPEMRGLILLEQLRKADTAMQVIVLSGHPSVQDARMCLKAGAFDYLMKPQSVEDLFTKIRAAFKHRQETARETQHKEIESILSDMPD